MRRIAPVLAAGVLGFILGIVAAIIWLKVPMEARTIEARDPSAAQNTSQPAATPLFAPDTEPKREPAPTSMRATPAPIASDKSSDSPGTLVFGTLLDAAGQPIRGSRSASVTFVDSIGKRRYCDANQGAYAISGLPPGSYSVSARAFGYRAHEESLDVSATPPVLQKDFTLQEAVVLKIKAVTPEGKPLLPELRDAKYSGMLWSLVPVATKDPPGPHIYEVFGSLNTPFGVGQFWQYGPLVEKLTPECMGVLWLDGDLPVYVSLVLSHAVLQTQRVEPGTDEVAFVFTPEQVLANLTRVQVKVVDAETQGPLEGASVSLTGGPSGGGGSNTNSAGMATIEHGLPGRFALRIGREGYELFRKMTDVEPGGLTDLGTIALEKEVTLQGRFVDEQGAAVQVSFQLGLLPPGSRTIEWDQDYGYSSDATGSFTVKKLGHKQYVLRTINHDAAYDGEKTASASVSGNVMLDARSGSLQGRVIRLKTGSLLVLRVKSATAERLRFRVLDDQGFALAWDRFYGPGPRPLRLPPGAYRVALLDAQDNVLSESAVSVGAATMELELVR